MRACWAIAVAILLSTPAAWCAPLEDAEHPSLDKTQAAAASRPWYQSLSLSGFLNAGYAQTGSASALPAGHFYVAERRFGAALFVDADVSTHVRVFTEIQLKAMALILVESYLHFPDLFPDTRQDLLSVKVGRFEIPFGEEYVWQDAIANPLILRTAAWPWAFDEGIELFGSLGRFGWVAAVTDGALSATADDKGDKALTLKAHATPVDPLYVSLSFYRNGRAATSPFWIDEVPTTPVGSTVAAGGASTSPNAGLTALELDAKVDLGGGSGLSANYGLIEVSDIRPYRRTMDYFFVQVIVALSPTHYLAGRGSSVSVHDGKGYRLGGDYNGAHTFASGGKTLFDTRSVQRLEVGTGYWPHPSVLLKASVAWDWVRFLDGTSAPNPKSKDRWFAGGEIVVKF